MALLGDDDEGEIAVSPLPMTAAVILSRKTTAEAEWPVV